LFKITPALITKDTKDSDGGLDGDAADAGAAHLSPDGGKLLLVFSIPAPDSHRLTLTQSARLAPALSPFAV